MGKQIIIRSATEYNSDLKLQRKKLTFIQWFVRIFNPFELNPGRGMEHAGQSLFFPIISCLEHLLFFYNVLFLCWNILFQFSGFFWESDFVPGRPGTFAPALVPGQRDSGTRKYFCPRPKGQWSRCHKLHITAVLQLFPTQLI